MRRTLTTAVTLVGMALAGCSSDHETAPSTTPGHSPTVTVTPEAQRRRRVAASHHRAVDRLRGWAAGYLCAHQDRYSR